MDGTPERSQALVQQQPVNATFEKPEIVTLSVRQAIAPNTRLLGTIEWTNWSRFGVIPIVGSGPVTGSATDRTCLAIGMTAGCIRLASSMTSAKS